MLTVSQIPTLYETFDDPLPLFIVLTFFKLKLASRNLFERDWGENIEDLYSALHFSKYLQSKYDNN